MKYIADLFALIGLCAKVAEQYGPDRPIITKQPGERVKGNWEGEQAASSGISAAIRARSKA